MMSRKTVIIVLSTFLFTLAQDEMAGLKTRIGIMDPEVSGGGEKMVAAILKHLSKYISEVGGYDIYTQDGMEKAFAEIDQRFPKFCREPRCVSAVGSALQLDRMLYGSVDKSDKTYAARFTLVDVQSKQIIEKVSLEGDAGVGLEDVISVAVSRLHGHVDNDLDTAINRYYGKQVHNEKELLISAGACVVAGLLWAIINNEFIDGTKEDYSGNLSGIGTSCNLIPVCARPAALGNAYVAASDDAYGVFYNPAGLSWASGREAVFGYQYRYTLNNFVASYVNKATREIGYGQGFQYTGDVDNLYSEVTFISGISYKFNDLISFMRPFSVGLNLKIMSKKTGDGGVGEHAQKGSGFGIGLDLGMQLELTEKIRGAILFENIPSFIKYNNVSRNSEYLEFEPVEFLLGGQFQANYATFLICEFAIPLYREQVWKGKAGIERVIFRVMRLRIGIEKPEGLDTPWKVNGGLGVHIPMEAKYFALDGSYEYNSFGPFSNVLNFSFRFGF